MAYQDDSGGGFRAWINEGAGKVVTVIVVILLIGVAGWAGYRKWNERGSSKARKVYEAGHTLKYICESCKNSGESNFPYDVAFPAKCPQCNEMAAYPAFACRACRKMIRNTGGALVICPHCQHQHHLEQMPANIPPPPPIR